MFMFIMGARRAAEDDFFSDLQTVRASTKGNSFLGGPSIAIRQSLSWVSGRSLLSSEDKIKFLTEPALTTGSMHRTGQRQLGQLDQIAKLISMILIDETPQVSNPIPRIPLCDHHPLHGLPFLSYLLWAYDRLCMGTDFLTAFLFPFMGLCIAKGLDEHL